MFGLIHLVDPYLVMRVRGHVYVLGISMVSLHLVSRVRGHVYVLDMSMLPLFLRGDV
jgi:hypothetical protein